MQNKRGLINILILLIGIPAVIFFGMVLFKGKNYNIISIIIAILSCIPFFIKFEKESTDSRKLIVLAVMIVISAMGRFVFAAVPGFKPVTAIVVITAMYLGAEAGFITGSFSALVSNMYFGQGPWTPFQMFAWGFLGLLAGFMARKGWLKNKIALAIYGVFAGVLYSLMLDIWSVLSIDGTLNIARYLTMIAGSFLFMCDYAVSNVIFLLILEKPIGKKLQRIITKYKLSTD